jgi:hypothetical protein
MYPAAQHHPPLPFRCDGRGTRHLQEADVYLRKITLILMISMVASFSIRTLGTVSPRLITNNHIIKATCLMNAFFILSHLLFWLVFYRDYISTQKATLKRTCLIAVIGSLAVTAIYMKKIPFVFGINIPLPLFLKNPYIDAVVPLISPAFHLIFFMAFRNSLAPDEKLALNKPVLSINIGIIIFIGLHLIVLINFLATGRLQWLEHMPRVVAVGTVPLIIGAAFSILFFYYRFYCFLDSGFRRKDNHWNVKLP